MVIAEKYINMANSIKIEENEDKEKIEMLKRKIEDAKRVQENAINDIDNLKNDARRKYRLKMLKINEDFQDALFEEYDVKNHPKREKMYSKAWERGHSSGYSQIESEFAEIVELMVD